jgi:hypothetical protein
MMAHAQVVPITFSGDLPTVSSVTSVVVILMENVYLGVLFVTCILYSFGTGC